MTSAQDCKFEAGMGCGKSCDFENRSSVELKNWFDSASSEFDLDAYAASAASSSFGFPVVEPVFFASSVWADRFAELSVWLEERRQRGASSESWIFPAFLNLYEAGIESLPGASTVDAKMTLLKGLETLYPVCRHVYGVKPPKGWLSAEQSCNLESIADAFALGAASSDGLGGSYVDKEKNSSSSSASRSRRFSAP